LAALASLFREQALLPAETPLMNLDEIVTQE
jgi:hypothetical protein